MSNKPTHEVCHDSLYLAVDGKLQEMKVGTRIALGAKAADSLIAKGRVRLIADEAETVVVDDEIDALKALKARAAELNIDGASRWGESRLIAEIAKAEESIAALDAAVNT